MALPTSGTITLDEIIAEFGGPTNLTAYYRGGGHVPDITSNNNVPTAGTITLTDFYGATQVQLISESFGTNATGGINNAGTGITFYSNGVLQLDQARGVGQTITNPFVWLGAGSAASYQISATLVNETIVGTGSVTGTFGTWINLTTSPEWFVTAPQSASSVDANIQFQIRGTSDDVVVATAVIELSARVIGGGG